MTVAMRLAEASRFQELHAAHDDIAGIAIAAAVASSKPSGSGTRCDAFTTVRSAMLPNGARGKIK